MNHMQQKLNDKVQVCVGKELGMREPAHLRVERSLGEDGSRILPSAQLCSPTSPLLQTPLLQMPLLQHPDARPSPPPPLTPPPPCILPPCTPYHRISRCLRPSPVSPARSPQRCSEWTHSAARLLQVRLATTRPPRFPVPP